MYATIGSFEVRRHHRFELWVAFVMPDCAPVTRLVVDGWGVSPSVATPQCPTVIGAIAPVLHSPVLRSSKLVSSGSIIPFARLTRDMPLAQALGACVGLSSVLSGGFALAQPLLREIPSLD